MSNPTAATVSPTVAAVAISGVTVRFGDFTAVDNASLSLERGRIHALVGQNGAGKTTLARAVMGLLRPDAGTVLLNGEPLPAGDVPAARAAGIEMVHQGFILPPSFTVAEALEMFDPVPGRRTGYRARSIERRWDAQLAASAIPASSKSRIRDLPIESLQAIEILRALARNARVLILDEPTAVLPPPAIERLFDRLRAIRDSGVTVIVVLHKVAEVLALAETVTVLRAGRIALPPTPAAELTPTQLANLIVGADAADLAAQVVLTGAAVVRDPKATDDTRPTVVALRDVRTKRTTAEAPLDGVSLDVREGEIVGIAGVEGNGQRSLVEAIVGLQTVTRGAIELRRADIARKSPAARRRLGLRVVPYDRNAEGISATSTIWENVAVGELMSQPSGPLINVAALRRNAREALERWHVSFQGLDQRAGSLSGGNVQRLIFAREIRGEPRLVIAAQPTRGLDVGATAFVHETLGRLRADGAGILLVSSDLDELFALSDRIVVLLGGHVAATFKAPFNLGAVGAAMVGAAMVGAAPEADA